jgi:hypothetical protein
VHGIDRHLQPGGADALKISHRVQFSQIGREGVDVGQQAGLSGSGQGEGGGDVLGGDGGLNLLDDGRRAEPA